MRHMDEWQLILISSFFDDAIYIRKIFDDILFLEIVDNVRLLGNDRTRIIIIAIYPAMPFIERLEMILVFGLETILV